MSPKRQPVGFSYMRRLNLITYVLNDHKVQGLLLNASIIIHTRTVFEHESILLNKLKPLNELVTYLFFWNGCDRGLDS